jgi:hypothetical protein
MLMAAAMQGDGSGGDQLTPSECDAVAAAIIAQFDSLPRNGKPTHGEWTVLAGIAAVRATPTTPLIHVLSCCTGTKCLGRSRLQGCGSLLHDSHAEVIARRNMLLSVLKEFTRIVGEGPGASSSGFVLEWPLGEQRPRVIPGTRLCLYVSQSPCGDASIYDVSGDVQQLLPSKRQRVQERLSAGDGPVGCCTTSIPIEPNIDTTSATSTTSTSIMQLTGARVAFASETNAMYKLDAAPPPQQAVGVMRTKPGRGPPTHCMSCSDKILRWCCEGLQGAAAACLFNLPLACVIIGDQFNAAACHRAFTSRCTALGVSPPQIAPTHRVFACSRHMIERAAAAAAGDDVSAAADAAAAAAARAAPLSVHWRAGAGCCSEVSIANGIRHGTTLRARAAGGDNGALVSVCKRLMLLHTSRAVTAAAAAGILPSTSRALWELPLGAEPPSSWAASVSWTHAKGGQDRPRWKDRVAALKAGHWVGAPEGVDAFCLGTAVLSRPLEAEAAEKGADKQARDE